MKEELNLNSKEIKKYILDSSNDLQELSSYLEKDFVHTVEGVFGAIFVLLRHYSQNQSRIDHLIYFIESLLPDLEDKEGEVISSSVASLESKVSNFKLKDRIAIKDCLLRLENICYYVANKKAMGVKNKKVKYLSFLIFEEKNLHLIEKYIQSSQGLLSSNNELGENIFTIVLKKYLSFVDDAHEEAQYYYQVILLFMNSHYREKIFSLKKYYLGLVQRMGKSYQENIVRVMELFDLDFSLSLEQLEERYQIQFSFFPHILKEVEEFSFHPLERSDFTSQKCVTIDGDSTCCFDDAIYLEDRKDGTHFLYIHISDVPSFVPMNSIVNKEARKRGEALYLKGLRIPMYPEVISDDVCSLLVGRERNVISYIFHLDSNYQVIEDDFSFVPGKIVVSSRLSYSSCDEIILGEENTSLALMLRGLVKFAEVRKEGNRERNIYREYQNAMEINPHHESLKWDVSPSANIVHESMVLVNYRIGKYFKDKDLPYLYRKIDLPSDDFIREQLIRIKNLEINFLSEKEIYQRIKDSYTKAYYTKDPVFHLGQNLECYSHSSSPVRRYGDSFNQYLLHQFAFSSYLDRDIYYREYQLEEMVRHLNQKKKENEVFSNHYNYLVGKNLIKKK